MSRTEIIGDATLILGDCLDVLPTLEAASFHAVVTDPPYELSFMGRAWDSTGVAFRPETWAAVLRVLRPGGHMVCFGGTRTAHRMVCAIEDAGFEIRDSLCWLYGSGFPKSLDIGKAIDKTRDDRSHVLRVTSFMADAADRMGVTRADVDARMGTSDMGGWWLSRLIHRCQCPKLDQYAALKRLLGLTDEMDAEVWRLNGRKGNPGENWDKREVIGQRSVNRGLAFTSDGPDHLDVTAPATPEAAQWHGWGSSLKPAHEPIVLARKPLDNCTIAANVLKHGVGGINIDACRVGTTKDVPASGSGHRKMNGYGFGAERGDTSGHDPNIGRWPSNLCHDGSDEVMAAFAAFGERKTCSPDQIGMGREGNHTNGIYGAKASKITTAYGDTGTAARFFKSCPYSEEESLRFHYSSKANAKDRAESKHTTVKPLALMEWLVKLITPPGGKVLDPFAGSGITAEACMKLGFDCTLIDIEAANVRDIQHRIKRWSGQDTPLFAETV